MQNVNLDKGSCFFGEVILTYVDNFVTLSCYKTATTIPIETQSLYFPFK